MERPIASIADAIVFAVYMPPQAPSPGHVARSIASSSSLVMRPVAHAPTASNVSTIVRSRPSRWPGSVVPAYTKTAARSRRAAAITMPGRDLSQPASNTDPSSRSANITVSTESAITSRETSDARMPSWPMEIPSETEIVPNSSGKPAAARTPSFAAFASRSSDRLQGVISFQLDATPICGLSQSSSVIPTARNIARAGARSMPSVTSWLRGLRRWCDGVDRSDVPDMWRSLRAEMITAVAHFEYLSGDGTRIRGWRNRDDGEGVPVVVSNGLGTPPTAWPALIRNNSGFRAVTWYYRGTGGSDRPADPTRIRVEDHMADLLALMDHEGIDKALLVCWSLGVNIAFEFAEQFPERVAGLLAVAGVPGGTFHAMGGLLRVPRRLRHPLFVAGARFLSAAGGALSWGASRLPMNPFVIN